MSLNLTPRIVAYIAHEEGLVAEAYKDSRGIWTWSMGLATTGGYDVLQYKDKPAPLVVCLRAAIDAIRDHYLPSQERAFAGHALTEGQIAAALSFHWNTGAIGTAQWVKDFCAGKTDRASANIMQWSSRGLLTARREREAALFFHDVWPSDLTVPLYDVAKPSYRPVKPRRFNALPTLQQIMGQKA